MGNFIDLTGRVFGRLTVVRLAYKKCKRKRTYWECKCTCGETAIIRASSLTCGITKSCGCLHAEGGIKQEGKETSAFHSLFCSYKSRAIKNGRDFTLSEERFEELTRCDCFYCGKKPDQERKYKGRDSYFYNGLDRIDSSKGYVEENVVPCCGRCNAAKSGELQSDFLNWIKRVYEHSLTDNQKYDIIES